MNKFGRALERDAQDIECVDEYVLVLVKEVAVGIEHDADATGSEVA
tara:strand:+ start:180 stop:317 length:138 start_codon:yes stop_codon:yes gene_type:complete